jgi:hypothetical protein
VDGSTDLTQLDISPLAVAQRPGLAHDFPLGPRRRTVLLNVGSIEVTSGRIGSILGYHTARLSGPVTVGGHRPVDRLAFQSLEPGAAILVAGDLNTLDVLTNANLAGGPGHLRRVATSTRSASARTSRSATARTSRSSATWA